MGGTAEGLVVGEDGLARPPWAATDPLLREYYDTEWGMPVRDERGLFERLSLEAFQSGLSWATILRKREHFRDAFVGFDPDTVAAFGEADVERLLADPGIVRNRRKIEATIRNAAATVALREDGGLPALIWSFRPEVTPAPRSVAEIPTVSPESVALAAALKRRGFAHVGPTTMYALMEAVGIVDTHLVGSHRRGTSGVWGRSHTGAANLTDHVDRVDPVERAGTRRDGGADPGSGDPECRERRGSATFPPPPAGLQAGWRDPRGSGTRGRT